MQAKYSIYFYFAMFYILIQCIETVEPLKCYTCDDCNKEQNEIKSCDKLQNACLVRLSLWNYFFDLDFYSSNSH